MGWLGTVARGLVGLAGIGVVAVAGGPRPRIDFERIEEPEVPELAALEAWLAEREAQVPDLRPDSEKKIVWADPAQRARTEVALVYIHGFGADRIEISPVPENVAASLGANLFSTRLRGHGRSIPDSMAEGTAEDWMTDTLEAIDVASRLGERVVVIATSTGGALAGWAASGPRHDEIDALVLISPNFGPANPASVLLTGPWGRALTQAILGDYREWEPDNEVVAAHWTTRQPSQCVVDMQMTVDLARESALEQIVIPTFAAYSTQDTVLNVDRLIEGIDRLGGDVERLVLGEVGDDSNHVIAGDACSPEQTQPMSDALSAWLTKVL